MYGPKPQGFWTRGQPVDYGHLHAGRAYRVVRAFVDFDGVTHPEGERWTFLGSNYLPHDAGLSLFVSLDGKQEWHLRMQCYPEAQGPVVDRLEQYLEPVPD